MKRAQLIEAGVPEHCTEEAIDCIRKAASFGEAHDLRQALAEVVRTPEWHTKDEVWGFLACALVSARELASLKREPIQFRRWGTDIDEKALDQMALACELPVARKAAVMPDAHLGYGVPIGCVLATEDAVIPNAVGVDIGCRMKLSIFDAAPILLDWRRQELRDALREETRFGVGCEFETPREHPVMHDHRWRDTQFLRDLREKARRQLGTSGGGNHFVEFGYAETETGNFLALMSHSGSRGMGSKIATRYHRLAKSMLPHAFRRFRELAWLDLDKEAGQEYWTAMNLAGSYAQANHDCIHDAIAKRLDLKVASVVENHHNFAWREMHDGQSLVVHRKGATPAGRNTLGVIPGDMVAPAFIVQGAGNPDSLFSASHGAGRAMSRTQAKREISMPDAMVYLELHDVELMSAGHDELPGAYKDIHEVMAAQTDLVEVLGKFYPKLVLMSGERR